jgi:ubiquitin carboxyl-terminal hydrolase 1
VLHIKRFSGGMEKISSYIPTPFVLKCFCNKCYNKKDEDKLHVYKLYSVITHVGATMSVGHYIAYTCSLDIHDEYVNCASDKRKFSTSFNNGGNINLNNEKSTGLVKKFIYGKNKSSSNGDMSKSLKSMNGLSKIMLNGIEKLNLNSANSQQTNNTTNQSTSAIICQGLNCCGIYVKDFGSLLENHANSNNGDHHLTNNEQSQQNAADATSNGQAKSTFNNFNGNHYSSSTNKNINQQTWYMCDDDKIKIMSQREFEELLSPNQKVTITPYLLFYARYDAQNVKEQTD